jgi:hypothetical protein
MMRSLVLGAALLASTATATDAQTARPAEGRLFGMGLGLGSASFSVGDQTNREFSASVVGRIGIDSRNRVLLMGELYPVGVTNPVADETARSAGVLVGFNVGGRVKLRPSLGWAFHSWSGSQMVESTSSGLLLGLDLGTEFRLKPGLTLSAEVVFRYTSIELEGNVRGGVLGVQLVAAWRGSGQ